MLQIGLSNSVCFLTQIIPDHLPDLNSRLVNEAMTKLIPGEALELYKVNFFRKVKALKFTRMSQLCIIEHIQAFGDLISLSFVVCATVVLSLPWPAGIADQPALVNTQVPQQNCEVGCFTFQSESLVSYNVH